MQVDILFSGSRGNSILIRHGSTAVLVDAGRSARRISSDLSRLGLSLSSLSAIFITHEHCDHTGSLETLAKKWQLPIYATEKSAAVFAQSGTFAAQKVVLTEIGAPVQIGSLSFSSFPIPHDSQCNVGYRVQDTDGDTLGIATDMGHVTETVKENLTGCRRAVIESNHDVEMLKNGIYPQHLKERILSDHGHLSNENCGKLAVYLAENGTESVTLAHLSEQNNRPELAKAAVEAALIAAGHILPVTVAKADDITTVA